MGTAMAIGQAMPYVSQMMTNPTTGKNMSGFVKSFFPRGLPALFSKDNGLSGMFSRNNGIAGIVDSMAGVAGAITNPIAAAATNILESKQAPPPSNGPPGGVIINFSPNLNNSNDTNLGTKVSDEQTLTYHADKTNTNLLHSVTDSNKINDSGNKTVNKQHHETNSTNQENPAVPEIPPDYGKEMPIPESTFSGNYEKKNNSKEGYSRRSRSSKYLMGDELFDFPLNIGEQVSTNPDAGAKFTGEGEFSFANLWSKPMRTAWFTIVLIVLIALGVLIMSSNGAISAALAGNPQAAAQAAGSGVLSMLGAVSLVGGVGLLLAKAFDVEFLN